MAAEQWMEIYQAYTSDELNAGIVQLKKDVRGAFSAQGHGGTSHQWDLPELPAMTNHDDRGVLLPSRRQPDAVAGPVVDAEATVYLS